MDPSLLKAISSNVAQYVTVREFVRALRAVVIQELEPQLLNAGRKLSETQPCPYSRLTLVACKTVFNRVPCENEFDLKVLQSEFERLLPTEFSDLLIFILP